MLLQPITTNPDNSNQQKLMLLCTVHNSKLKEVEAITTNIPPEKVVNKACLKI